MAYDVFLVSALEDRDMAKLVARRLRALKFKVWLDQKQTDDTFDAKDARDAMNSQSMLVLWSKEAVKSDWVRAAASIGHSRPGMLVQVGLDKTIPYEPFKIDKRESLIDMTSRKTPEGFYKTVEELGRRDGRTDLRAWMGYGSKDEEDKSKWLADHPTDPLAIAAKKARDKKLGIKPAPAAAAVGAAALAAASVKGSSGTPTAAAGASASLSSKPAAAAAIAHDDEDLGVGLGTILAVLAAIALMFLLGYLFRSKPVTAQLATMPPVANSQFVNACPAGEVPRVLLRSMEPGPIINDTE